MLTSKVLKALLLTYISTSSFNPCHAEYIKLPRLFLIVSQSDYLILIVDLNSTIRYSSRPLFQLGSLVKNQNSTANSVYPNKPAHSAGLKGVKGSIFLKNRHFIIQERFNKLIWY